MTTPTNRTVLIQSDITGTGTGFILISPEAIAYLQMITPNPFTVYTNPTDIGEVILTEYTKGVRRFILNISSSVLTNPTFLALIQRLADAKFIFLHNLAALPGPISNLYFISTSLTVQANLMALYFQDFIAQTCLLYNTTTPGLDEFIQAFKMAGYGTYNVNDIPGWQQHQPPYTILITIFLDASSFSTVNSNLLPPPTTYSIYSGSIYPTGLTASNITNISMLSPKTSIMPQIDSYWNIVTKNVDFDEATTYTLYIPVLLNSDWDWLAQANLISTTDVQNGIYFFRYLPFNKIEIKSNIFNCHLPEGPLKKIAWIVAKEYADVYLRNNIAYLKEFNPNIKKVKITSNPTKTFKCLWKCGYRNFILEMPSKDLKRIQKLEPCEGLFICNRATDPNLRKAGSQFLFALADDNTMVQTLIASSNKNVNGNAVCVLGQSNNINIEEFRKQLEIQGIQHFDDIALVPATAQVIYSVGNDANYETMLSYIESHPAQFPNLLDIRRYGNYITADQAARVKALGITSDYVTMNFNGGQPFLESKYCQVSRPLYLANTVNFLDLANILLGLDVKTLYYGGYIIDV